MEEVLEGSMHHPSKMRLHNTKKNFMGKVNGGTNEYSYTKRFPVKNFNSEYLWQFQFTDTQRTSCSLGELQVETAKYFMIGE